MTSHAPQLRDENGQAIVMFVLVMSMFFALIALVVNAGAWLQEKHQAEGAVEAAALAAAQVDPGDRAATCATYLEANWPGAQLASGSSCTPPTVGSLDPRPSRVETTITAEKNSPAVFAGLLELFGLGEFKELTIRATGSAIAESPAQANKDQVAPLALLCDPTCLQRWRDTGQNPWPIDPDTNASDTVQFRFTEDSLEDPTATSFGTVKFTGGMNEPHFATDLLSRQPTSATPPECLSDPSCYVSSGTFNRLKIDDADSLRVSLRPSESKLHLVGVYDRFTTGPGQDEFHVIGWAAITYFVIEDDPDPRVVQLDVTFHKFFYDSARLGPNLANDTDSNYDFGVLATGLSG